MCPDDFMNSLLSSQFSRFCRTLSSEGDVRIPTLGIPVLLFTLAASRNYVKDCHWPSALAGENIAMFSFLYIE